MWNQFDHHIFCIKDNKLLFSVLQRYHKNLEDAKNVGIRKAITVNIAMGFTFFMIYMSYALAFWYGSTLILAEEYNAGILLTVSHSNVITKTSQNSVVFLLKPRVTLVMLQILQNLNPPPK